MSPRRAAPRRAVTGLPRGPRLVGVSAASSPWKASSRGNRGADRDRIATDRSPNAPSHTMLESQNQRSSQSLRPTHGIPGSPLKGRSNASAMTVSASKSCAPATPASARANRTTHPALLGSAIRR